MLKMVRAKPMQLTMVSAVPTYTLGAFCATTAENCGLSPTTEKPQVSNPRRKSHFGKKNRNGESKQKIPEISSMAKATFGLPFFIEKYPPKTQPAPPIAMVRKDHNGIEIFVPCISLNVDSMIGTNAHIAYSSHMWPKYPNAAERKALKRKIWGITFHSNFGAACLNGPSPTVK